MRDAALDQAEAPRRRLLPDRPVVHVDDYVARGGGDGLRRALAMDPLDVITQVERSGLRGRGGAGFPTGRKWRGNVDLARGWPAARTFLVANAAEGEPGTYKDRPLLERNPFAVVEGLLIARHAVQAAATFVGIKARATDATQQLADALDQAAAAGWAGAADVQVVRGPDEYLFGEESALLEVVEGGPALPRVLAPYEEGLYATDEAPNPTVVNNVETLANVPGILANGPAWFRLEGTPSSPGTMLFTVTGDVAAPGVYELPLGTPLRVLLEDVAGATDIKAVYSGTSNAVITPAMLDDPLDFEVLHADGAGIGSGGFVVYDSTHPILRVLRPLTAFLAFESCGQCNPCKLGTAALVELLDQLLDGSGDAGTVAALWRRCVTVTDGRRCYLPVGAQLMVGSTLTAFQDEIAAGLGRPVPGQDVPIPLIEHLDHATGAVTWSDHPGYRPELQGTGGDPIGWQP